MSERRSARPRSEELKVDRMGEFKLFESEYRFMKLIWEREPVGSTELAKEALTRLGWKKSTCYTVLKKLSERR